MLAARWLPLIWVTSEVLLDRQALQMWQKNLLATSDWSAIVRARLVSIPCWLDDPVAPAANCQQYRHRRGGVRSHGTLKHSSNIQSEATAVWNVTCHHEEMSAKIKELPIPLQSLFQSQDRAVGRNKGKRLGSGYVYAKNPCAPLQTCSNIVRCSLPLVSRQAQCSVLLARAVCYCSLIRCYLLDNGVS